MRCMAATNSSRTASRSADGCAKRDCEYGIGARARTITAPNSAFSQVDIHALCWLSNMDMKSKVVAILETRTGAHLADLIARRGGVPMLAPALEEVPDIDPQAVSSLLAQWRIGPFKIFIFPTRVGTRGPVAAADTAGLRPGLPGL